MYIIVSLNLSNTKKGEYSYSVSKAEFSSLVIGSQVIVNFHNQLKIGTVIKKSKINDLDFALKPILAIYKFNPLNEYQSIIARQIYDNGVAGLLDVQNLFIKQIADSKINIEYYDGNTLVGNFKDNRKLADDSKLQSKVIVNEKVVDQTYSYIEAVPNLEIELTPKQMQVYEYLQGKGVISLSQVEADSGVSRAVINKVIEKGGFIKTMRTKQFDTLFSLDWHTENQLSVEQQLAYDSLTSGVNLLHGVSSSGKTEIYINRTKEVIAKGEQVLIVVPSVMLAVQVVGRMQKLFDDVIVYHDKLTEGEKYSFSQQIADGSKKIVISTFKGLFLPFDKLGLAVFDEAHSPSYQVKGHININKQVVIKGLQNAGVEVLLGTATPSIIDYALTEYNKYNLVTINSRYGQFNFPDIKFVKPDESVISSDLQQLININVTRNKPTLVFFNKSGYSKQMLCLDCFHLHLCPNCQKPLSYSKKRNRFECKYDGFKANYTGKCSKCSSSNLKLIGIGIERFSDNLKQMFPDLVIEIVDGKMSAEQLHQIMADYGKGAIDVLIGTQTIAFGIDFLNVDSIYIANIDNLLTMNEFSSHERTYNLLEQVAGRVGRGMKFSNAFIETNFEQHFVMKAIENHDYNYYYKHEMELRKQAKLPPYYRICKIEFLSDNPRKIENIVNRFKTAISNDVDFISDIQSPYIDYRFGHHRRYILITYRHQNIKSIILNNIDIIKKNNIDYIIDLNNNEIGV